MNRRDLLQLLGLAPVVALTSTPAQAAVEGGKTPDDWNERKLFTITSTIDETLASKVLLALATNNGPAPAPEPDPLRKIATVIQAVTQTPDIRSPARVGIFDKDGTLWNDYDIQTHTLFLDGPSTLARLIICAGRDMIAKSMPPHLQKLADLVLRMENGAMEEQLKNLGSVEVRFNYYGPPPYPPGAIHTFNYKTNAFEPLRRA